MSARGTEEAAVMMVGLEIEQTRQGLAILDSQLRGTERGLCDWFQITMCRMWSEKVVRII